MFFRGRQTGRKRNAVGLRDKAHVDVWMQISQRAVLSFLEAVWEEAQREGEPATLARKWAKEEDGE